MTDITKSTIAELKEKLSKQEISAAELCNIFYQKIEKDNPKINAFIHLTKEQALANAEKSQKLISQGKARLLEGIPLGIKDNFCNINTPTQAASHILDKFTPTYESTVTQNLWNSGALMLGKLNMDEFAMGSANITSHYGNCINPIKASNHDKELVPGGSSGGSAAAVAANLCAGATASDTGGSIRQPASFTGLVGLKPSYGRCSRWGMIAFASSLDQAGPLTKTVEDSALMLQAMAGHDAKDSTSADVKVEDYLANLGADIKGKKIGIPKEYQTSDMPQEIKQIWEATASELKQLGAEIIDISLPHTKYAISTYYIISTAEAASNLARYDGVRYGLRVSDPGDNLDAMYEKTRGEGFGTEVKRRIMLGTYVLSSGYYDAYYQKAQKVRRLISQDFDNAFSKVDAILAPTTPSPAFALDEKLSTIEMYLNDIFTVSANLAGICAISIPAGLSSNNLPLGMQLMAPRFAEAKLLNIAQQAETAIEFDRNKLKLII
jgi:aspartyl-tRNA(Asn)/glutamyl-tRNA(Gln) amidotransferase subunit A